jgi:hypothetical protein
VNVKPSAASSVTRTPVNLTINHDGDPAFHCGLIERGAKASRNGEHSDDSSSQEEKDGLSAALLEDLTIQRTAALRAELAARPDIALITVTHNLVAQIFYEPMYGLPSSLTIRTDAYTERVDLRSASEAQAAKAPDEPLVAQALPFVGGPSPLPPAFLSSAIVAPVLVDNMTVEAAIPVRRGQARPGQAQAGPNA